MIRQVFWPPKSEPSVLSNSWLCTEEIEDILKSLHRLEEYWEPLWAGNYNKMFSLSMSAASAARRDVQVDQSKKPIMMEEFSWLYTKLFDTLGERYSRPIRFSPNMNYPGFYIFNGPLYTGGYMDDLSLSEQDRSSDSLEVHQSRKLLYHRDMYSLDEFNGTYTEIDSYVVPISVPSAPTGLKWQDYQGVDRDLEYTVGMLVHWDGMQLHAIGDVICLEGEARITFQIHCSIQADEIVVFW